MYCPIQTRKPNSEIFQEISLNEDRDPHAIANSVSYRELSVIRRENWRQIRRSLYVGAVGALVVAITGDLWTWTKKAFVFFWEHVSIKWIS
jgi:hypothetical protein